jgi:SNF2 family DNA or RNA helicase
VSTANRTATDLGEVAQSTKMIVLMKILEKCRELKESVLVFSFSLSTLDYIENMLSDEGGFNWQRLEGSVSRRDREKRIESFNNRENNNHVFLISMKTGSLGINLTTASRVVFVDMGWNPSHNIQAAARVCWIPNCLLIIFIGLQNWTEEDYLYLSPAKRWNY